jgi:hypothetical protein
MAIKGYPNRRAGSSAPALVVTGWRIMRRAVSDDFPRWGWLLVAVIWGVVGAIGFGAWMIAHEGSLAEESAGWPWVQGTVLSSSASVGGGYRSPITYGVAIRYRFTVDGHTYEGSRTAFNPQFSRQGSQAMADSHPPGSNVLVYYRPGEPETCVLEPGGRAETWIVVVLALTGLVIAALAAFTTWFALLMSRRPRPPAALQVHEVTRVRIETRVL